MKEKAEKGVHRNKNFNLPRKHLQLQRRFVIHFFVFKVKVRMIMEREEKVVKEAPVWADVVAEKVKMQKQTTKLKKLSNTARNFVVCH